MDISDKESIKQKLELSRHITDDGHWLYTGSIDTKGYGQMGVDYAVYKVNRLSLYVYTDNFDIHNPQLLALHKCLRTDCFAPDHLSPGDHSENTLDSVKDGTHFNKNKKTCKNGHLLVWENVYTEVKSNGRVARHCMECRAAALRRMRLRQKEKRNGRRKAST